MVKDLIEELSDPRVLIVIIHVGKVAVRITK